MVNIALDKPICLKARYVVLNITKDKVYEINNIFFERGNCTYIVKNDEGLMQEYSPSVFEDMQLYCK